MRVVLTEKPSVARDLARVLGVRGRQQGYIEGPGIRITWCVGHLLELEEPSHYDSAWRRWSFETLPMLPDAFALRPRKGASDQWRVVKRLLSDRGVSEIVNACDAGREGELIFRYAYQASGARAPILRFWASSLTDAAVQAAWSRLQPGSQFAALDAAARCRSEADWLVGLNATRAMTVLTRQGGGGGLLSVGRVQTPTLALIVRRDQEIDAFVPEDFWTVEGELSADVDQQEQRFRARWFARGRRDDEDERQGASVAERLDSRDDAEALVAAVTGREAVVTVADRKTRREKPPLLYDLTSLQRRANQRYGFSADKTLELAQALYEKHKVLSYPRTDARFITDAELAELPSVLGALATLRPYEATANALLGAPMIPGKRVVNAAEVGDHHAILPTDKAPAAGRMSADEKRIYDLVARRLLAALSPDAEFALAHIEVEVQTDAALPGGVPSPPTFRAKGRVCLARGWQAIDPPKTKKDRELPHVRVGDRVRMASAECKDGQTRPPRRYDDALILGAMETAGRELDDRELARIMRNAGLGTPATRAAILKTLIQRKFVTRKGKELWSTETGRALIDAIPVDELTSAELTARWEARLSEIAEARDSREAFMAAVGEQVRRIVDAIRVATPPSSEVFAAEEREAKKVLGSCPVCGRDVSEGFKAFGCATGRECAFVVFKTMSKRKISARMVSALLKDGRTEVVKGFKSKQGKPFEAALEWSVEEQRVRFAFPPRSGAEPPQAPSPAPAAAPERASPVGMTCPRCGLGRIVAGRSAWGCDRWRDGCKLVLSFESDGRRLSGPEAVQRLRRMG